MCIKGPESWWIAKSITPQLVVNQSKINPQLPLVVIVTDFSIQDAVSHGIGAIHQLSGPLIHIPVWYINNFTIIYCTKKHIIFFTV